MIAGADISPGNQILALTAKRANANSKTIRAGRTVERKNVNSLGPSDRHSA